MIEKDPDIKQRRKYTALLFLFELSLLRLIYWVVVNYESLSAEQWVLSITGTIVLLILSILLSVKVNRLHHNRNK